MFSLSYEMLDILNYQKYENILFEIGIANALSKALANSVLFFVVPNDDAIAPCLFLADPWEFYLAVKR